jgi:hypothetical protein
MGAAAGISPRFVLDREKHAGVFWTLFAAVLLGPVSEPHAAGATSLRNQSCGFRFVRPGTTQAAGGHTGWRRRPVGGSTGDGCPAGGWSPAELATGSPAGSRQRLLGGAALSLRQDPRPPHAADRTAVALKTRPRGPLHAVLGQRGGPDRTRKRRRHPASAVGDALRTPVSLGSSEVPVPWTSVVLAALARAQGHVGGGRSPPRKGRRARSDSVYGSRPLGCAASRRRDPGRAARACPGEEGRPAAKRRERRFRVC